MFNVLKVKFSPGRHLQDENLGANHVLSGR